MKPVMSPCDVAAEFGVDPKTVSRWAKAGKLPSFRTPGGHLRFRAAELIADGILPGPIDEEAE